MPVLWTGRLVRRFRTSPRLRVVTAVAASSAVVVGGIVGPYASQTAAGQAVPQVVVATNTALTSAHVIAPGGSYTVVLSQLPADATSAAITVTARSAWRATQLSVCPGAVVTHACTKASRVPVRAIWGGFGAVKVDLAGADRKVTVYNSGSYASVTLKLTGYTRPTPATSTPSPTTVSPTPAGGASSSGARAAAGGGSSSSGGAPSTTPGWSPTAGVLTPGGETTTPPQTPAGPGTPSSPATSGPASSSPAASSPAAETPSSSPTTTAPRTTAPTPPPASSGSVKVLAHYFVPFPISQDNKAPSSDYYAVNYLPANGEGGAHAAYGGFLRDRPIGRAPLAGDWRLTDMKTEVDQAISGGIDGFTIDLLSLDGLNWDRTVRMMDAAAADGRGFVIVPQLDMTASAGSADPSLIASKLAELAAKPAQYRLADGRVVISAFEAEAKAPQWWSSLFAQLKSRYGIDVAFMPVFLNASDANIASFAPISYVEGNWGTRNPGNILAGPNYAAKAHAAGTKWMAPVSDQDERPNQGLYQEAANTETLRAGWQRAISDDADLVCVVAWNDYSEGTVLAPSVAHGRSFLDINAYYASWFTRGSAPKIAHDMLVVTHRIQPYAAKQLTAESKLMVPAPSGSTGTAPRDTAGVLAFLAAPATVTLRSGENSKTVTLPAGVSEVTVPLGVGTVSASAARGGATVASVTSPVAVTRTPVVQDLQYYASEVGHWW